MNPTIATHKKKIRNLSITLLICAILVLLTFLMHIHQIILFSPIGIMLSRILFIYVFFLLVIFYIEYESLKTRFMLYRLYKKEDE